MTDKYINAGFPQGFVLRPLLFLIYVNYIAESLEVLQGYLQMKAL